MGEKRGMQALEIWCRQVTAGYNGVNVTNMTSSWKDGLAFCALVHHFRPDLIDFASLSAENVYQNNQLAFSVAENVLGIPALLDAEDMVNYIPDRLSIMTYLSQFYQVLAAPKSKGGSSLSIGLKRPAERDVGAPGAGRNDDPNSSLPKTGATTPVKIFARQLQNDGASSRPQARRVSDLCVSCKNPVFLAERLMVNGRLHHRVCFRCARCQSQLSLANYYETEQEQYCCETCPDEVAAVHKAAECIPSDHPIPANCGPSAIATSPEETISSAQNVAVPQEQPERVSHQQRSFLDSMVAATDATIEVTLDSRSVPDDQRKIDDDNEKRNSSADVCDSVETTATVTESGDDDRKIAVTEPVSESGSAVADSQDVVELEVAQDTDLSLTINKEFTPHEIVTLCNVPEADPQLGNAEEVNQDATVTEPLEEKENGVSISTDVPTTTELGKEGDVHDEQPADSFDGKKEVSSSPVPPAIQVTATEDSQDVALVVPKPRRRKSKRSSTPQNKIVNKSIDEYPEELNPFDDDPPLEDGSPTPANPVDQTSSFSSGQSTGTPEKVLPAPKISLNPFGSDDEDEEENARNDPGKSSEKIRPGRPPPPVLKSPPHSLNINPSPSPKKRPAPAPPPPKPQRTPSLMSADGDVNAVSKRKSAPPPPTIDLSKSPMPSPQTGSRVTSSVSSPEPNRTQAISSPPQSLCSTPSEKAHKDLSNLHLQCSVNKDSHGQWKRKKGPAPPRPSPQKRQLRKLPLMGIQQELDDIEIKQVELERQGVSLEQSIRDLTEPEDGSEPISDGSIHIEEMILQLFDLVNEKNELLRRQTELMYLRRQQRLEEEHAELEYQIRCLLEKPNGEKSADDRLKEEELINRLVQVVHRRAEIVDCLEMDRQRQVEEDQSIQQHLDVFNSRGSVPAAVDTRNVQASPSKTKTKTLKMIQSPIKLMKKDKLKKSKKNKVDADKEVDDTEVAGPLPSQSVANETSASSPSVPKEKEKHKTKSWFAK
ncbi:MICAL-like protein 1 isoform X2 [Daphnia carinata]|uniref:MICAL-like protein 1 isoform X2 n=1 Tax=Daphnia carinata TaxID=120202 RepID=UPI00257D2605|nr:MICAL-like protein 1 isoform X2 [Daphnia carinata]